MSVIPSVGSVFQARRPGDSIMSLPTIRIGEDSRLLLRIKESDMLPPQALHELHSAWLPNMTDAGLTRLIELLEKGSPLLISGCFTKAIPMGCLASHVAWNHPATASQNVEAGINWLHRVAGLNPATSCVLREWDLRGAKDLDLRESLLTAFRQELTDRPREEPIDHDPVLAFR